MKDAMWSACVFRHVPSKATDLREEIIPRVLPIDELPKKHARGVQAERMTRLGVKQHCPIVKLLPEHDRRVGYGLFSLVHCNTSSPSDRYSPGRRGTHRAKCKAYAGRLPVGRLLAVTFPWLRPGRTSRGKFRMNCGGLPIGCSLMLEGACRHADRHAHHQMPECLPMVLCTLEDGPVPVSRNCRDELQDFLTVVCFTKGPVTGR